jgi:hypothetical protein
MKGTRQCDGGKLKQHMATPHGILYIVVFASTCRLLSLFFHLSAFRDGVVLSTSVDRDGHPY